MKIGILGSGDVGQALAAGFLGLGHEVMIGSRDPDSKKLSDWQHAAGTGAYTGEFAEAAAFGEIVVLATLWSGTGNALTLADAPRTLLGKIVIDVTNPLVFPKDGPPTLAIGHSDSGGEQVQRWLPRARVVKAFNTVTNSLMVRPQFSDGPATLMIAGNDQKAKQTVTKIAGSFGWTDIIDIGGIEGARLLEPLCVLWVTCSLALGEWNTAFKLLRPSAPQQEAPAFEQA